MPRLRTICAKRASKRQRPAEYARIFDAEPFTHRPTRFGIGDAKPLRMKPASTLQPTKATPRTHDEAWEIDSSRSTLSFSLRHIIFHEIRGQFRRWGGKLLVDRNTPSNSTVDIWVDLSSVETDSTERDEQVRSAEFFDVAHFPRAIFRNRSVEASPDHIQVRGELDLHGVSHPVDVTVFFGPGATDEASPRAEYEATATINRQDFGLRWCQDFDSGGVVVGDRVALRAHVEAVRSRGPA